MIVVVISTALDVVGTVAGPVTDEPGIDVVDPGLFAGTELLGVALDVVTG